MEYLNGRTLLCGCVALCLCIITYLGLSTKRQATVRLRLTLRARRISPAGTPPQSLTPEKDLLDAPALKSPPYVKAFPPSQRPVLPILAVSLSDTQRKALGQGEFDEDKFRGSLLEYEEDYRTARDDKFSYAGFSVREIKALGNFPDYATLSGVPLPQPYQNFDYTKAVFRPYRPFRWAYHQTMSLTKMEVDWWLEIEQQYKERIAQRQELYRKHGEAVLQHLPGSELACKELVEVAIQFLCARYPQYFTLSVTADGKYVFENRILNTTETTGDKHPMLFLLDHIPEDFAVMLRHPETGYYHFRAGLLCSALGWNVASKIGLQLHEIHAPIPDYKEKMQFSMDRWFTKLETHKPIQRGSWGLEVDQPLYMPPGDPHEHYRDLQTPGLTLDRVHLRVDWQTLRRLPLSGAIIFNFRAVFTPLSEFKDEAYIPELVLKILNEGKENIMKYKNTWHVEHVAKPVLETWAKEQKHKGMVEADWEVSTLPESPYYPGWEEKWRKRQGF